MVNLKRNFISNNFLIKVLCLGLSSVTLFANESTIDRTTVEKPVLKWSGTVSSEGCLAIYTTLMNKELAEDKINWIRSTVDLKADCKFGEKMFGHDAVKFHTTLRHRNPWGFNAARTDKSNFKLGDVFGFGHAHGLSKPPIWVKTLFLDFSLDSIFTDSPGKDLHRCKVGFFPFSIGKGVALGEAYGVSQDFLGDFIPVNDYNMPGLLLFGGSPYGFFSYNLYFAKPQARSSSSAQVLGLTKGHLLGTSSEKERLGKDQIPFAGAFKDDYLVAGSLDFKIESDSTKTVLSPYAVYFYSPDNKVKVDFDTKIDLLTAGFAGEFSSDYFDIGFDTALNYGHQVIRPSDANAVSLFINDAGFVIENYSKINTVSTGQPAVVTKSLKQTLAKDLHRDGKEFSDGMYNFISSADRINEGYVNKLRGKMAVCDFSLKMPAICGAVSGIVGYASGDVNPNSSSQDSTYNGFIGINESFSSKRVPSYIVFDGVAAKRPMTVEAGGKPYLKDYIVGNFTDIRFLGCGASLAPERFKSGCKAKFSIGVLSFWKDCPGLKINTTTDAVTGETTLSFGDQNASTHLGIEGNCGMVVEPLPGLSLGLRFALFQPGRYYSDIKGARLNDDITKALEAADFDQIMKDKYSISNDTCYIIGVDIRYSF